MTATNDHLIAECRKLEESCLYTGQTHFEMAKSQGKISKAVLVLLPSLISAASGFFVAIGGPAWVGAFAAGAGLVTAVAAFLGVDKDAGAHEAAGRVLTQLREEARALREARAPGLTAE